MMTMMMVLLMTKGDEENDIFMREAEPLKVEDDHHLITIKVVITVIILIMSRLTARSLKS